MLPSIRSRRRSRYGAQVCAVMSALLLLLSVSLLYGRLSSSHNQSHHHHHRLVHSENAADSATILHHNAFLSDSDSDSDSKDNSIDDVVDKIDELDTFEDQVDITDFRNDDDESSEGDLENGQAQIKKKISSAGYFQDRMTGSIRRALNKRSIDEWDYDSNSFSLGLNVEDQIKAAFRSDDIPIDEDVTGKVNEVEGIEDALLLKIGRRVSPLRKGWGDWFDKKGDFLRRDRMFKSNLEALNSLNNPLLQDPDGVGVTGLTRGDKAVQKLLFNEFKRTPFIAKKPLRVLRTIRGNAAEENSDEVEISMIGDNDRQKESGNDFNSRRIFYDSRKEDFLLYGDETSNKIQGDNSCNRSSTESIKNCNENGNANRNSGKDRNLSNEDSTGGELRQMGGMEDRESNVQQRKSEKLDHIYADGKRWGYFPGLQPHLSFSDFMDSFFRKGKCDMRVFMVWNSPPWMYTVRHQRGLESLLFHHKDACVVVLSETIDLNFFADSFVKDGYKVAVAMPNLDELLNETPTSVFADVWSEWRQTKFYSTHYSELVRLVVLYKYGGVYLDSDIIVLNPLSSLNNTVGLEGQVTGDSLNGAVMAFRKNSLFIMECLKEFYVTYDDAHLRWNGADLLTRIARNFLSMEGKSMKQQELKVQPSYIFFPISSQDITRLTSFSNGLLQAGGPNLRLQDSLKVSTGECVFLALPDGTTIVLLLSCEMLQAQHCPFPLSLVNKEFSNWCSHINGSSDPDPSKVGKSNFVYWGTIPTPASSSD